MILEEDPVELAFANIFSYLAGAYAAGGCFADYLDKVHDNNPSSFNNPWSCILYVDELHPGNQLAGNSRKYMGNLLFICPVWGHAVKF